jgi:hypothetical protein
MVQIHLGPQSVSPGQGGFHPDEHRLEAPGMPRTQRNSKAFPGPDVPWLSRRPQCSGVTTVQLRNELVLSVWKQVPVEVVGRSDVRVAHAPHDLEGIATLVDHERGVAELMKRERFDLQRDPCSHYKFVKNGDRDGFSLWLTDYTKSYIEPMLATKLQVSFVHIEDVTVCRVDILPFSAPVFLTDKGAQRFYVRVNNATHELSGHDLLKYQSERWARH